MFPKLHGAFSLVYLEKDTIEETPAVLIFIRGFVFCKLKDCLVFEKTEGSSSCGWHNPKLHFVALLDGGFTMKHACVFYTSNC